MLNRLSILFLFLINSFIAFSQLAPGEWRDHLPYKRAIKTVIAGDKVYCCTQNSLYYYDKTDFTKNTISKVQGLTEASIASIAYSQTSDVLVVVYENLNVDLLKNFKVTNFPYVKNKAGIPYKKLNDISIVKNLAYLSCSFGLVVIDIDKTIVAETYYPGNTGKVEPIMDVAFDDNYIYAAAANKIYRGKKDDPFLADNSRWELFKNFNGTSTIKAIEILNENLFALIDNPIWGKDSVIYYNGSIWQATSVPQSEFRTMSSANNKIYITGLRVFQIDANLNSSYSDIYWDATYTTADAENTLWIADDYQSMIRIKSDNTVDTISPNSPTYAKSTQIDVLDDQVWTVTGGLNALWGKLGNNEGFAGYYNNSWHSFEGRLNKNSTFFNDFANVFINPYNPSEVYIATSGSGLLKFENGNFTQYTSDNKNSTIQRNIDYSDAGFLVYGMAMDNQQNLWITNSWTKRQLSVKTKAGKWKSFALPYVGTNYNKVGDIIATSWGPKWIVSPLSATLAIYDDNGTIEDETDDASTTFNLSSLVSSENALVESKEITCIVEDLDQNIWVGTDAGPVEISGAQNVFQENGAFAKKIKIPINIGENLAAFLLETERINTIAIDGGNRKWMGTQSSGAYLISADGLKQLAHFTIENSPLLSNTINDIAINHKTGEVFFASDNGIVSYRGYATAGGSEFGDVYVFPNPVREDYHGDIIVTNLLTDAIVKITDVAGNLVFETRAAGGQAVWNGKNLIGNRVNTGVYLVFCSNNDGTKTHVTKLLFIH
jgi:hypothetical protein